MSEAGRGAGTTPLGRYKRFVKMAQSVARKGAPVLRIAYPIWVLNGPDGPEIGLPLFP